MIPCQKDKFDIPDHITYLNCAYTSPLLCSSEKQGLSAVRAKKTPWKITPTDFFTTLELIRGLFATLVNCPADDVAVIPAVSYGIALAAKNIPLREGQNILVLEDQFPSNIYSWNRLAQENRGQMRIVKRPHDHDWTAAIIQAMDENTAIVALPTCHWTDGTLIDLVRIGEICREKKSALVLDGTQSLGAMPFSIPEVQPDFLITTAHKWLLGPYSMGFCYVHPRWQTGIPLEENWLNRKGSQDFSRLVDYQDDYQPGARRFDVGESSNFFLTPVVKASLEQLLEWGVGNIAETLGSKIDEIAKKAMKLGYEVPGKSVRAPHMIGLSMPGGVPEDLVLRLSEKNIFVSVRGDAIRIAPHLYNSNEDLARLFEALQPGNCQ